jgi:hypothetical protein
MSIQKNYLYSVVVVQRLGRLGITLFRPGFRSLLKSSLRKSPIQLEEH